jgi:hypothetical protein
MEFNALPKADAAAAAPPHTPFTVRRRRQEEEASEELVAALREIELLQASLESREAVDGEAELASAYVKVDNLERQLLESTSEHEVALEKVRQEMRAQMQKQINAIQTKTQQSELEREQERERERKNSRLQQFHESSSQSETDIVIQDSSPLASGAMEESEDKEDSDAMKEMSAVLEKQSGELLELERVLKEKEHQLEVATKQHGTKMEEQRSASERQTMQIMDKHSSLLEKLRTTKKQLVDVETKLADEQLKVEQLEGDVEMKSTTIETMKEEKIKMLKAHQLELEKNMEAGKNELKAELETAELRRVRDLEAQQAGHHQIMSFHLKSQEDIAEQKLSKAASEFNEKLQDTHAKHEEVVVRVRRQSVVQIKTLHEQHKQQVQKTKDQVKRKVREYERNRTKRKLIKQNDKHSKLLVHREKLSARRAVRERVVQLQSQIIKNEYPKGCFTCGTTFTMFLRVHHCRSCGMAVCDACSQIRVTADNLKLTRDQLRDSLAKEITVGCGGGGSGGGGGVFRVDGMESATLTEDALNQHSGGGGGWDDLEREEEQMMPAGFPTSLRVCDLCNGSTEMLKLGAEEEEEEDILGVMSDGGSRRGSTVAESVMSDATYLNERF